MTAPKPGRASVKVRVRSVEDQPCPGRTDAGGMHLLTCNRSGQMYCVGCKETYADLDAELNAGRRRRGGSL